MEKVQYLSKYVKLIYSIEHNINFFEYVNNYVKKINNLCLQAT